MATRRQLFEWHTELCKGGFLPPFNPPDYNYYDGLDLRDVEYWSGGIQLVTACGLQRIIALSGDAWGKHILLHTSNNKQEQLQHVSERFTRLDDLYGMLLTTMHNAIKAKSLFEHRYTVDDHHECNRNEQMRQRLEEEERTKAKKEVPMSCLIMAS
jgi:hypothetical protein